MRGLNWRKAVVSLAVAMGIALAGLAVVLMPRASALQTPGDQQVIDLTRSDGVSATSVPETGDRRQGKPKGQTPVPKPSQDGLATRPEPIVILNSGMVTQNSEVVARGVGFEPFEDVLVSIYNSSGDLENEVGLIQADKEGNFADAKFAVANTVAPGEHVVVATGQKSGVSGQASFQVQPSGPWLALDSYSEKPYARVTFKGGGFDPREDIALYFDSVSTNPVGTLRADAYGGLTGASVTVPMLGAGQHSFILMGQTSRTTVSSPFSVLGFYPWVGLSSYSPQPEQSIGFIGHDFAPRERVSYFLNTISTNVLGTVAADGNGNFETENIFEIPTSAVGELTLVFYGGTSQMPITATLNVLPFNPGLELSTYAGPPGTSVSFIGQGFARDETVHVYLGQAGGREISTLTTDQTGSFKGAGEFRMPFDAGSGKITLTAVGEKSRVPVSLVFAVLEVQPWVGLSEYNAPPGTVITFTGNGFGLGETVNVYAGNDRSQPIATAQADDTGAFTAADSYVIPEDARGKIDFTFVGEQSKATATATFTVAEFPASPEGQDEPVDNR